MKTIRGQQAYKLPPLSKVHLVVLKGKDYDMHVSWISVEAMSTLDNKLLGCPNHCSIMNGNLLLWPVPAEEWEIIVRYAPPLMEF